MKRGHVLLTLALSFAYWGSPVAQKTSDQLETPKVVRGQTTPHNLTPTKRALIEPVMALHYAEEIQLTEAQKASIQKEMSEARNQFVALERKLDEASRQLDRLLENPSADDRQVVDQMDRVLAAEREIKLVNLLSCLRVRQHLRPEQREKLLTLDLPPPPPPPPPPHVFVPPGAPAPRPHPRAPQAPD